MSGPAFHNTGYGRKFFEADLPNLIRGIGRLAEAIEKANELEEAKKEEQPIPEGQVRPIPVEEAPFHDPLIAEQDRRAEEEQSEAEGG
jgi:hypothetical protein